MKNICSYCGQEFVGKGILFIPFEGASADLIDLFCSEKCRKKSAEIIKEIGSLFV